MNKTRRIIFVLCVLALLVWLFFVISNLLIAKQNLLPILLLHNASRKINLPPYGWTRQSCKPVYFLGGGKAGSTTLALLLKHKPPSYKTHNYNGQFTASEKEVCWAERSSISSTKYWSYFPECEKENDSPLFALDACPRYYSEHHAHTIASVHPNARFLML